MIMLDQDKMARFSGIGGNGNGKAGNKFAELKARAYRMAGKTREVRAEVRAKRVSRNLVKRLEVYWAKVWRDKYGVTYRVRPWSDKDKYVMKAFIGAYSEERIKAFMDEFVKVWDFLSSHGAVSGVPSVGYMWKVKEQLENIMNGHSDIEDEFGWRVNQGRGQGDANQQTSAGLSIHGNAADYSGWDGDKTGW